MVLGVLIFLATIYFGDGTKTHKYLIIAGICALVVGVMFFKKIEVLLGGFGSVKAANLLLTPELERTKLYEYFFGFHILLLTSIAGCYYFVKKWDAKKILFFGYAAPSLYLIITASRYMYFAAIPILTLTAIFLDNKKIIKKKFNIFIFLTITLMIFMTAYSYHAISIYYSTNLRITDTEPYFFLRDNVEKNACIISVADRGAVIEFFAKRYFYFHSLGTNEERAGKAARLLLLNKEELGIEHLYVLLNYADIYKINDINTHLNLQDIGFYRIGVSGDDEPLNETAVKDELGFMKTIFVNNNLILNQTGKGCVYAAQSDTFYFKDGVCNTTIFRMITNQTEEGFENIYFKDGNTIYKYKPTTS
jgi:asparagine N-glycosylation enzyme membrane subunit Stt3